MSSNKYTIILDTNVLGAYKANSLDSSNFNYLSIRKDVFFSLIDFLKNNSLTKNINIAVPRIVFEELKEQQENSFHAQVERLKNNFVKFNELPGFNLETPDVFDYKSHLTDKTEAFISKYNIGVIDYPPNAVLPKLIQKAINKKKPFYKKEKDKDSGFKDTLIWESLLEFVKNNRDRNIIFFTNDSDFNDSNLLKEFTDIAGKELKVISSLADIKTFLDENQKLHLDFLIISNSFDRDFHHSLYQTLRDNFFDIQTALGIFHVIDFEVGTQILDINKIDKDKYEIHVPMNVIHETSYTGYGIVDDIYQPYEEDAHSGIAIIIIKKTDKNEIFLEEISFAMITLLSYAKIDRIRLK